MTETLYITADSAKTELGMAKTALDCLMTLIVCGDLDCGTDAGLDSLATFVRGIDLRLDHVMGSLEALRRGCAQLDATDAPAAPRNVAEGRSDTGALLATRREALGLSGIEMAKRLGQSVGWVIDLEHDGVSSCPSDVLREVCRCYGVRADDLLGHG